MPRTSSLLFFFVYVSAVLLICSILPTNQSSLDSTHIISSSPSVLRVGAQRADGGRNTGGALRKNDPQDYYAVLGLEDKRDDATEREIKSAWRKLSKIHHPDIAGESSRSVYQTVQRAYEILGDRRKRKIYDILGEDGIQKAEQGQPPGAGDPNNWMFQMFGMGQGVDRSTGANAELAVYVNLADMYNGEAHTVSFSKTKICRSCKGSGARSAKDLHPCLTCRGKGRVQQNVQIAPGFYTRMEQECPKCHGTGKKIAFVCPMCKGRKLLRGLTKISVDVEAGTPEGHSITYELEADQQPGQVPGDVVVSIYSVPHAHFTREGALTLRTTVKLTLKEALIGFEKSIQHMDGHAIELSSNSVTQHLQEERIVGEGMPRLHVPSEKGDLIVTYEVEFPQRLTDAQKKAIRGVY